jgi:hypothetical protein
VFSGIALESTDADRLINFSSPTYRFTGMHTNSSQNPWEWDLLPDHSQCCLWIFHCHKPEITRDIDTGRTLMNTWQQSSLPLVRLIYLFVHESPCGAYLHAGGAEPASGFTEIRSDRSYDWPSLLIENEVHGPYTTDLTAYTDAPAAPDAKVVIPLE